MSETKKPGFFGRLFGRGNQPQPQADVETEDALKRATGEVATSTDELDAFRERRETEEAQAETDREAAEALPPQPAIEEPPPAPPAPPEAIAPVELTPATATPVPEPAEEIPAPPPAPEPAPALEEEELPLPPGPPETTLDYVEDVQEAEQAAAPAPVAEPAATPRQSWFQRLTSGLKRSSDQITGGITSVFTKRKLDAATLDELEDVLLQADLGMDTTSAIVETLRRDRFDKD
ncbi:MAG: signal recognition particle receptor subunit alpha, partial [Devosia nanyangense]|nr:signal recognition particle receptor subunit alpha [Devosia nanyangense]